METSRADPPHPNACFAATPVLESDEGGHLIGPGAAVRGRGTTGRRLTTASTVDYRACLDRPRHGLNARARAPAGLGARSRRSDDGLAQPARSARRALSHNRSSSSHPVGNFLMQIGKPSQSKVPQRYGELKRRGEAVLSIPMRRSFMCRRGYATSRDRVRLRTASTSAMGRVCRSRRIGRSAATSERPAAHSFPILCPLRGSSRWTSTGYLCVAIVPTRSDSGFQARPEFVKEIVICQESAG